MLMKNAIGTLVTFYREWLSSICFDPMRLRVGEQEKTIINFSLFAKIYSIVELIRKSWRTFPSKFRNVFSEEIL